MDGGRDLRVSIRTQQALAARQNAPRKKAAPRNGRTTVKDWRQSLSAALWTGLILLAVLIYSQKNSGAFEPPGSPLSACLVATLAMMPSLLAWSLWAPTGKGARPVVIYLRAGAMTLLPPLALGIALLPAGLTVGVWYLASLSAISCVALMMTGRGGLFSIETRVRESRVGATHHKQVSAMIPQEVLDQPRIPLGGQTRQPISDNITQNASECPTALLRTDDGRLFPSDGGLHPPYLQQLTRSSSLQQGDVLHGTVTAHFEAGQRQANVHVAFVPPFTIIPIVECEALDGCEVRLKVGTVQTFGIRIEIKRTGNCRDAETAEIGFSAMAPVRHANAA